MNNHPDLSLSRRRVLLTTAAGFPALGKAARAMPKRELLTLSSLPDFARASTETGLLTLERQGSVWRARDVALTATISGDLGLDLKLTSPHSHTLRIQLRWRLTPAADLRYLGDHWERSYGDLAWRTMEPERIMPWYFLASNAGCTFACGVKTGAAAFCCWQIDGAGLSLWMDVRNGGSGVRLGDRELSLGSVVTRSYQEISPFSAAQDFCHRLSEKPRLPATPIYGGNNWYYAYGKSSAAAIREDSKRISSFAGANANRPFMVIDDGWQTNSTAGPWTTGNAQFPDMPRLAADMRAIGVRPGLWMRPLFTKEPVPESWCLASPNAKRELTAHQAYTLDPTVPDVAAKVQEDLRTAVSWGYEMIKHDFSTYDLLGRWGFNMGADITDSGWSFADRSLTNAEIILSVYRSLRAAAADVLLLGCNTVGHLAAGLFEVQRTGDDTSGRDWNRTRKMGVNTLAFRAPQHGAFFALDADCVGITQHIPWNFNRQWLELLARSGTPLFVSAAPDALGPEQRIAIQAAFSVAARPAPVAEPLDWLANNEPSRWRLHGRTMDFDWFGNDGAAPFQS